MLRSYLATAIQPIVHNDPAVGQANTSNNLTFNREKVPYYLPNETTDYQYKATFCQLFPIPSTIAIYFENASFVEFACTALVKKFIDLHGGGEGEGLMNGIERYSRLEARLRNSAIKNATIIDFWSSIHNDMLCTTVNAGADTTQMLALLRSIEKQVIAYLIKNAQTCILIARAWKDAEIQIKKSNGNADLFGDNSTSILSFEKTFASDSEMIEIEIPAFQINGLRHQIRESAFKYLCKALDIPMSVTSGGGLLPAGVEALFYNGGNLAAGSKAPGNQFEVKGIIRKQYPSLDLLGGCIDGMDLGESMLDVSGVLVCRENYSRVLAKAPELTVDTCPALNVPANQFLSEITHTRHQSPQGVGQMIMGTEVLIPNSQFIFEFDINEFADPLTVGAFATAFDYWNRRPIIGGMSRIGYGELSNVLINNEFDNDYYEECKQQYKSYLETNKDSLRENLINGKLGFGKQVCS